MVAVLALGAFWVIVLAGLALWITPTACDDVPEFPDIDSIRRHHERTAALERATRIGSER